jgi:hypothetical protein
MYLKQLPHVKILNANSILMSDIKDDKNQNTNEEYRFDSIEQLHICANTPWETVLRLLNYFPKLINLDVYLDDFCVLLLGDLNDILGPFPLNDAAGTEYLRRVNRIRERKEKFSLDQSEIINRLNESRKRLGLNDLLSG